MPQKKKTDIVIYVIFALIVYIFGMLAVFHYISYQANYPDASVTGLLNAALSNSLLRPFDFLPFTSAHLSGLGLWSLVYLVVLMMIYTEAEKDAKRMKKDENGSAKWFDDMDKYNKEYTDPKGSKTHDGPNNMILGNDVFLSMIQRQTLRNSNILCIGGSGSGKSRFFVKPNVLQANTSYVITDPSGELLTSLGSFLEKKGYKIKVFNLVDMEHSNCYNPFNYIRDDLGVLMLVNCLIKNTTPPGSSKGDPFWEKSETALLQALMFYLIKYRPKEERNFTNIMKLLRAAEIDENNPNAKSQLDRLFDEVARKDPNSIALKQYTTFKMGAGKTLKSILISCAVRLTVFNMKEIENLTGTDNIDLGTLGDEKQALFVVIPAADDTYNFIVSMMYSQLFETLYYHAEIECPKGYYLTNKKTGDKKFASTVEDADNFIETNPDYEKSEGYKRLASHVRFLLDEFANIGQIPDFDKKLATMRKYEISCSIILQNLAQIKEMYDKKAEGLIGNCDTILFLGSSEYETCEYISKKLGKGTVVVRDNSRNFGSKSGSSLSYKKSGRELMTPDEVSRMDNSECIIFIRSLQAFKTKKYNYPKHPNYKETGDADISNIYDYESKFDNSMSRLEKTIEETIKERTSGMNIQKAAKISDVKDGLEKENNEMNKPKSSVNVKEDSSEKKPVSSSLNKARNADEKREDGKEKEEKRPAKKKEAEVNTEKNTEEEPQKEPIKEDVEIPTMGRTPKMETEVVQKSNQRNKNSYNKNRKQTRNEVQRQNKKTTKKSDNADDEKEEWMF